MPVVAQAWSDHTSDHLENLFRFTPSDCQLFPERACELGRGSWRRGAPIIDSFDVIGRVAGDSPCHPCKVFTIVVESIAHTLRLSAAKPA